MYFYFYLSFWLKSKALRLLSLLYVDFHYSVQSGNMNSHCLFGHWVLCIAFSVFDLLEKSIQTFLLFSSITQSPFLLCGASVSYS